MSVEANAVVEANPAPVAMDGDAELGAVWDRLERDNGAARDDGGKFTSANPEPEPAAEETLLEGGEGEVTEAVSEPSTPETADVPLPTNWRGLEETWGKIPAELRASIKERDDKLNHTLTQQGREIAAWKPVGETVQKYKDYFNGTRGNYKPHEAIDYLFNLQRQMDDNPVETLLSIADTYELRGKLAEMFGNGEVQAQPDSNVLIREINDLKRTIREMADPSKIDERVSQKLHEDRAAKETDDLISRVATKDAMPLFDQISEPDLVHFINNAWAKLGSTATQEAVLKRAYDSAINADPDLRAKAAALKTATSSDPERLAAAKRANESNLRSTSTGKTRDLTEDELLGQVFDKNHRG